MLQKYKISILSTNVLMYFLDNYMDRLQTVVDNVGMYYHLIVNTLIINLLKEGE